jgi:hypothetical protein
LSEALTEGTEEVVQVEVVVEGTESASLLLLTVTPHAAEFDLKPAGGDALEVIANGLAFFFMADSDGVAAPACMDILEPVLGKLDGDSESVTLAFALPTT